MVGLINILLFVGFSYVMLMMLASATRAMRRVGVAFGLLILLPFWGLQDWHLSVKLALGLLVVAVSVRLLIRPFVLPGWLRQRRVAFIYFGVLMFLIFLWSVLSDTPSFSVPALGVPAIIAAICLFRKSWLEWINPIAGRSNHA